MTRRLDKTLADYVAIAISPVLIMTLVGSLLFFLVEVFYQGRYSGRMLWIFFWFTIAIVLIGRISIELGKEGGEDPRTVGLGRKKACPTRRINEVLVATSRNLRIQKDPGCYSSPCTPSARGMVKEMLVFFAFTHALNTLITCL